MGHDSLRALNIQVNDDYSQVDMITVFWLLPACCSGQRGLECVLY